MEFFCRKNITHHLLSRTPLTWLYHGLKCGQRGLILLLLVSCGCTPNHQVSTVPLEPHVIDPSNVEVTSFPSVRQDRKIHAQYVEAKRHQKPGGANVSSELLAKGEVVYQEHCALCHGVRGDGNGDLRSSSNSQPLDFTAGVYKFRGTPTGQLPPQHDLFRTMTVGVARTSMSDYGDLLESDRRAVVEYIKSFSPRFRREPAGTPILPPPARTVTSDAIERGQGLYLQMFCPACHGEGAHGDGPLAHSLSDTSGRSIQPADLTNPRFKSGPGPASIYRSLMTGLDGTPMPSSGDSLTPEEAWDLARYVASLSTFGETP